MTPGPSGACWSRLYHASGGLGHESLSHRDGGKHWILIFSNAYALDFYSFKDFELMAKLHKDKSVKLEQVFKSLHCAGLS